MRKVFLGGSHVGPALPSMRRKAGERCARDVLPELVRRYDAALQIVSGEGARKLQENGGMAAWLREFERKEYSASA